ncbi:MULTISPECIES: hypothetical protein [unclassified Bradyrhizobium]|uniref:hypothetical protein n=1 Tax=unclassified Bradyrhizobium TaxID=2631580 RepID=UPI0028E662D3|nr:MULTISPECIES: hypothetical protein [unclassified Bradyrhizobium]
METNSEGSGGGGRWRIALLALVLIPFLPEITILLVSFGARLGGCEPAANAPCHLGPLAASALIRGALQAGSMVAIGFSFGLSAVWLALCYLAIVQGWRRRWSRILLALATSLPLAILPYFGPMLSISPLVNAECHPNEGGIPPWCRIYGGDVGDPAHEAVRIGWNVFIGAPVALVAFLVFVVALIVAGRRTSPQRRERVSG